METVDSPNEKFQSALDLIGESWLKNNLQTNDGDSNKDPGEYEVPITRGELPIVKSYRMAREDLRDDQTEVIELPAWRNESLDFLRIGWAYELVKDSPIIKPNGERLTDVSVKELFCERLRSESEFESSRYELEVAAAYEEIGHSPAFVKEDENNKKTPDIELLDLNPSVQIECKHCRKQSDNEQKQANRSNKLFEIIQDQLPPNSHIVLLELDKTPSKKEVEDLQDTLFSEKTHRISSKLSIDVPFGELTIVPLLTEEPIMYPKHGSKGLDLMVNFYEDIVRPVISNKFGISNDFDDFGNSVMLFEAKSGKATLHIRRVNFIAIRESTWGTDIYNRFQNQFSDVSKKLGEKPSVLHVNFPSLNEGDSLQELEIRKHAGGQLRLRPNVSGVVVSGLVYHPTFSEELAIRRRIEIPNYQPKHELPEEYKPIDPATAQSVDAMMKNDLNEELLSDPKGGEKAIAQEEGTLSFRFKPNETRPNHEKKHIIDMMSEDDKTRLVLAITPEEELQLKRLNIIDGCWICNIDISDIPEYDPIRIFITWDSKELGLSVGPQSDGELKHCRSENTVGRVENEEGVLQCVDNCSH